MKNGESNRGNGNLFKGKWFTQKNQFYLDYISVYELLNELTAKGWNPRQIREALEKGIEK